MVRPLRHAIARSVLHNSTVKEQHFQPRTATFSFETSASTFSHAKSRKRKENRQGTDSALRRKTAQRPHTRVRDSEHTRACTHSRMTCGRRHGEARVVPPSGRAGLGQAPGGSADDLGAGRRRAVRPLAVEHCITTTMLPLLPDNRAASSEECDPSIANTRGNASEHDSTNRIIFHKQAKNRPDTTIDITPQILLYICIHHTFLHHCTFLFIVFLIYVTLVFTVSLYRT